MIKYIKYVLSLMLFSLNGFATEGDPLNISIGITGSSASFTYRSIREGDVPLTEDIVSRCEFKKGFPDNPVSWSENHINRQKGGNSFSALILENSEGQPVGVLGFGRMPVLNYNPNFKDIIETYLGFGVIRLKNPEADSKYAQDNIERVDNQGIAVLLPILPQSLGEEKIKEALKIGISVVQFLKKSTILPFEGTAPTHLIGLYHPQDPLIPALEAVGFEILAKDGFKEYYSEPRVMAHLNLK